MSIYVCHECGGYKDADDGCYETADGMNLLCEECHMQMSCEHCEQLSVIELDGEQLCKTHADQWVRNEGQSEHAAQQEQSP